MVVLKFGGTSVGEADAIRRVSGIIGVEQRPSVVVVSALSGVTDALVNMTIAGATIPAHQTLEALLDRHLDATRMLPDGPARTALEQELRVISAQTAAALQDGGTGPLDPRAADEVVSAGELWSSRLLTALLCDQGTPAEWLDARQVLKTDSRHGAASPDLDATRDAMARLVSPVLSRGHIAVVGGFIGSDPQGRTTTLGRGGSDYSAAVFGACLDAEEIQIWTDVDGVLTADPRILPQARLVRHLSYGEAHDLASFGAKVLHPGTIAPAVQRNIPVIVRSSHRPSVSGTLVTGRDRIDRGSVVAGLACRPGATLIEAVACDGSDVSALTGHVCDALQAICGVDVTLAERCGDRLVVTIQDTDAGRSLDEALRAALTGIADVKVRTDCATVVVVGEDLASHATLATDAAAALREVPVHLTARPAGGRTLAFVVDAGNAATAVGRLHDCFFGLAPQSASAPRDVVRA